MAQVLTPQLPSQHGPGGHPQRALTPTVLTLHGTDPVTGLPATWHVTPMADDAAVGTYLVEHVEGDIHSPALWMQARRTAALIGEAEVLALVRRVLFDG